MFQEALPLCERIYPISAAQPFIALNLCSRYRRARERAVMRGSNVSDRLSQDTMNDVGMEITQETPFTQTLRSLRECVQKDDPDIYKIVMHTNNHSTSDHGTIYKALELSEVIALIVGVRHREVGTKETALWRSGATKRNRNQDFDQTTTDHSSYYLLGYVQLFLKSGYVCHDGLMKVNDANLILIVWHKEGSVIWAGSIVHFVPLSYKGHPSEIL